MPCCYYTIYRKRKRYLAEAQSPRDEEPDIHAILAAHPPVSAGEFLDLRYISYLNDDKDPEDDRALVLAARKEAFGPRPGPSKSPSDSKKDGRGDAGRSDAADGENAGDGENGGDGGEGGGDEDDGGSGAKSEEEEREEKTDDADEELEDDLLAGILRVGEASPQCRLQTVLIWNKSGMLEVGEASPENCCANVAETSIPSARVGVPPETPPETPPQGTPRTPPASPILAWTDFDDIDDEEDGDSGEAEDDVESMEEEEATTGCFSFFKRLRSSLSKLFR